MKITFAITKVAVLNAVVINVLLILFVTGVLHP